MSIADSIAHDVRSNLILPDIDYEKYADHDERNFIHPASEYRDAVWEHMHRPPERRGASLPWTKTHHIIQIRPGELSIWAGKRGQGKSLITSQVMLGLMKQGQGAVIASMEMPVEDTLERMERQGLCIPEPSEKYHRSFYEFLREKLWVYVQGGVVPDRRVLGLTRYSIMELGVTQVVIDSLMMVGFPSIRSQFDKLERQGEFVRDLAAIARDTGAHVHLVAHMRKGDGTQRRQDSDDVKGGGDITDLASVVYLISVNKRKDEEREKPVEQQSDAILGQPDLFLKVDKNRRGPVGGNFGLWMDQRSLAFVASKDARPLSVVSNE